LEVDESSFTGETVPCQKQSEPVLASKGELAELTNIAFMGTLVCNGHGRGVVIGTGYNTQFGEIFTLMESEVCNIDDSAGPDDISAYATSDPRFDL
jgi:Ca2+-transporting ATPase